MGGEPVETVSVLLQLFFGLSEFMTEFFFLAAFNQKKGHPCLYLLFPVAACILVSLPHTDRPLRLLLLLALLACTGIYGLKIPFRTALAHAFLIPEIMQLSWGISDSVTSLLFPFLHSVSPSAGPLLLQFCGGMLALATACVEYLAIYRYVLREKPEADRYFFLILVPLLLIDLVSWHIIQNLYGNTVFLSPASYHIRLLVIQLLAVISIFCILYAWKGMVRSLRQETGLRLLEQQNLFLRQYVEEARIHERETRALHHDMRNHLTVLKGFLEQGQPQKADAYISDLHISLEGTAFPFRTGREVVDILLKTKLAEACRRGIRTDCALWLPPSCRISDMDLCILLANALDNALHGCVRTKDGTETFLRISSRLQGDFLLLHMENSFDGNPDYDRGTGLNNIRRIAEKYAGRMEITTCGQIFCLHILLLSRHEPEA